MQTEGYGGCSHVCVSATMARGAFQGGKCWGSAHLNPLSYPAGAEWNIPLCHVRNHPQLLFLTETLETSLPCITEYHQTFLLNIVHNRLFLPTVPVG